MRKYWIILISEAPDDKDISFLADDGNFKHSAITNNYYTTICSIPRVSWDAVKCFYLF